MEDAVKQFQNQTLTSKEFKVEEEPKKVVLKISNIDRNGIMTIKFN